MSTLRVTLLLLAVPLAWSADPASAHRRPTPTASSSVCTTVLTDGRSFITGGGTATAPLAAAKFFQRVGGLVPAAPMMAPRSSHVCIALTDGSILAAGGFGGPGGPTNSAEIYHPDTDTWSTTGAMLTARTYAAAILMNDGRALIAGGQSSGQIANTLEIYDPSDGHFRPALGVLSSPRSHHAVAVLHDGRVLIAGGYDGTQVLDTLDIFDPSSETVRPAGTMLTRRQDFSATELEDGRVLLAGGFDGNVELASAELYDPVSGSVTPAASMASPRRSHTAIRPKGSDTVLFVGGSLHGRALPGAELFVALQASFVPAVEGTGPGTVTVGAIDSEGKPLNIRTYSTEAGH